MVSLERIRVPSKITRALKGVNLSKKLRALLLLRIKFENGEVEKFKVPSKWKPAKTQLIEESHGKCSFCECEIPSHQHGDVEHYRPKSIYWWMSYTIDNYLLSCEICNQRKSNTFEVRNNRELCGQLPLENDDIGIEEFLEPFTISPNLEEFDTETIGLITLRSLEDPKLLNPYVDDIEIYFKWSFDDALKEVEINPHANLSSVEKENAEYTISLLGLNRVPLKRRRYRELVKLLATINLGASTAQILNLYLDKESEFLGMNSFISKERNIF